MNQPIAHARRRTMTAIITSRPTSVLVLLLVTLVATGLSLLVLARVDAIVHGDLYKYGLEYSYEWAGPYWNYSRLTLGLLYVAILVTGVAVALILLQMRTPEVQPAKQLTNLFLVVGIAAIAAAMFLFTRIDLLVHGDLYRFGLQYSYEWAAPYWSYARLFFEVLAAAIGTGVFSTALFFFRAPPTELQLLHNPGKPPQRNLTRPISFLLTSGGVVALGFSIYFNSSILAFVGLGLIFWGVILLYARPEKSIKETLLDKTALPTLSTLNYVIEEIGLKGQAVYLPPRHFKAFESNKAYICAEADTKLPTPEKTREEEHKMFLSNPNAILLTPPGLELKRLFEKRLDTVFTRVDLQYLEQNLPKALVEDLEIAQDVEIETENNVVHVKTRNSIYRNMCKAAQELPKIHASLGCPFCSAIASALAEGTNKPVIIEQEQTGEDGETTDTRYRLLETTEE